MDTVQLMNEVQYVISKLESKDWTSIREVN